MRPRDFNDPRPLSGGGIAGPGGPHDRDGFVIDASHAVLLDYFGVASMTNPSDGRELWALEVAGRMNRSDERVRLMVVTGSDGLAAIVTEILAVVTRAGGQNRAAELLADITVRTERLRRDGNLDRRSPG